MLYNVYLTNKGNNESEIRRTYNVERSEIPIYREPSSNSFIFSYFLLSALYICRESFTNPLLFMQNKANLLAPQNERNLFYNKELQRKPPFQPPPKQTQFKAKQTQLAQMPKINVTYCLTTDYKEKRPSSHRKNKPNSNPNKANLLGCSKLT